MTLCACFGLGYLNLGTNGKSAALAYCDLGIYFTFTIAFGTLEECNSNTYVSMEMI